MRPLPPPPSTTRGRNDERGTLVLTNRRVIFQRLKSTSVAWAKVSSVKRDGLKLLIQREGRQTPRIFCFNQVADVAVAEMVSRLLIDETNLRYEAPWAITGLIRARKCIVLDNVWGVESARRKGVPYGWYSRNETSKCEIPLNGAAREALHAMLNHADELGHTALVHYIWCVSQHHPYDPPKRAEK